MSIYDDPGAKIPAPLTARAQILHDIIGFFGLTGPPGHSPVPNATKFTARAYPNPFNPMTKIELTMPRTAEVTVKIYNIRGELVQVLVDEVRTAGVSSVIWDGTNNSRASVASGVYFYEARMGHEVQVHKIALVK